MTLDTLRCPSQLSKYSENKFNKFKLPNPRIYNDFIKRKNTYKVTYVGFEKRLYPARIGDSVYNVNNFI